MKICILTQYYPPETGAPQNRLSSMAKGLKRNGVEVSIVTAMPNYPLMEIFEGYKRKIYCQEKIDGIDIHRCILFVSNNKRIFFRLLNYFSFVFSSLFIMLFKVKKQDVLICESPPLFLGISAWLWCRLKGTPLVMNISDLWPESAERLGLIKNSFVLNISTKLEEFLYRSSILISGQTQGIVSDISNRVSNKPVFWFPNGVDNDLPVISSDRKEWRIQNGFNDEHFLILYAGIMGHAQGLEVILKAASLLKSKPHIVFVLVGSGPVLPELKKLKNSLMLTNVLFVDSVSKPEMPNILNSIDAGVVPLKKLEIFKGAIPSKIFELLAYEKLVFLGVDGEAKELFVEQGNCAVHFDPENYTDLASKIIQIEENRDQLKQLGKNGRLYVNKHFNRKRLTDDFYRKLSEIIH